MAIVRRWSGDGLTAGTLTTSSAGTGDNAYNVVSGTGITISETGVRSPRILFPNDAQAHQARWTGLSSLTAYALRGYQTWGSWGSSSISLAQGLALNSQQWRIEINPSGLPRLRNAANTAVYTETTDAIPADGTLVRWELVVNLGTATLTFYRASDNEVLATGGGLVGTSAMDEIRFGKVTSIATTAQTFDDLAVSDTAAEIGPVSVTVNGTVVAALGALTATATGTRTVLGVTSDDFASLTTAINATRDVLAAVANPFGDLALTALGQREITASVACDFGDSTTTVIGLRETHAEADVELGALTAVFEGTTETRGVVDAPLAGAALTVTGNREIAGDASCDLGGLAATLEGTRDTTGVLYGPLGELTATAMAVREITGRVQVDLAGLTTQIAIPSNIIGEAHIPLGALTLTAVAQTQHDITVTAVVQPPSWAAAMLPSVWSAEVSDE